MTDYSYDRTAGGWELLENTETIIERLEKELMKKARVLLKVAVKRLEIAKFDVTNGGVHSDSNKKPSYYFAVTDLNGDRDSGYAHEAVKKALGYGISQWNEVRQGDGEYEFRYELPRR